MSAPNLSVPGQRHQFAITSNFHMATVLAVLNAKPLSRKYGPETSPKGSPICRWIFEGNSSTDEIMGFWQNPKKSMKSWESWSREDRHEIVSLIEAVLATQKHFLKDANQPR